ncbi:unnamed protein product [Symbiodinium sp. CCMP2592]|nr:unnamed protein product [Symbiodinium sp. CCMP2592]
MEGTQGLDSRQSNPELWEDDGASSVYSETEVMDESLCIRSREDPYVTYDSYTPETDDYDMLTAPLLPAQQSLEELESKQKSALRSRIARGGSLSVMTHYRKVLAKMEGINIEQHGSVPPVLKIDESNRVRLPSSDSLSTAFASWDTESDCSTPGSVTMTGVAYSVMPFFASDLLSWKGTSWRAFPYSPYAGFQLQQFAGLSTYPAGSRPPMASMSTMCGKSCW